ncbi:hypothetical protein RhiirA4_453799 [Rhizophagus irregularis]|uniref:Uncharacterized protein n=1 Tax=Rhizophagus irregularis TaxID=588596 RepID=A0A2I1G1C6_9GLOM|nr:hypothetical protein RhiirA4_453799 [Rhizophagus irregularis]
MQRYLHQDIEISYTEREIEIAKKQVEIESYMLCNGMLYAQEKEIIKYNIRQIAKNVVPWYETFNAWELSELKDKYRKHHKNAYVECKIWHFQGDEDYSQKSCHKAMNERHEYHAVKALIDTSSSINFISKSLANKLGEKYSEQYKNKKVKNSLGSIDCLELSFQYKGKDRLVSGSDEVFNNFEVIKNPKEQADLILGIPWLWVREAKIDMWKKGITIYGDFVPFCKGPGNDESFYNSDSDLGKVSLFRHFANLPKPPSFSSNLNSETDSSESDSTELKKKVKKLERTVDWIGNYVEEQTGLKPGKELTDSSDSDFEALIDPEKKIRKAEGLAISRSSGVKPTICLSGRSLCEKV